MSSEGMRKRGIVETLIALWEYDPTQYDPEEFDEGISPLVGAAMMIGITLLIAAVLFVFL